MKSSYKLVLTIVFFTFFANFCFANQEPLVNPLKKINIPEINFENFPEESKVGNLSGFVKNQASIADGLVEQIRSPGILHPYIEELAYVNGQLCHIGNYSQSVIYTILDGPYYGTQTTLTYTGAVLYVNYDYSVEYTPGGAILHHYYSDSEVITGSNQVIKFY